MFQLSSLLAPPPAGPSALVELDPTDPRVGDLAELAEKRLAPEALELAADILDEGALDVRVLCVWMWATFALRGPAALPELFAALGALLGPHVERVTPVRKRGEHLLRRTAWLCQRVTEGLAYHEQKSTPEWSRWTGQLTRDEVERALDALEAVDASLHPLGPLAAQPVAELAAQLRLLARSVEPAVASRPTAAARARARETREGEPREVREPEVEEVLELDASEVIPEDASLPVEGTEATGASHPGPLGGPPTLVAGEALGLDPQLLRLLPSHHFQDLVAKLDAFRVLVERQDWTKAAIVGDDLSQLIESFDPRLYFPGLFSDYSEAMSQHVEELAEVWAQRDSLGWKAASQFYRVDLRRFLGGTRG